MADALPLPAELINRQRALYAVQQAAEDYDKKVAAERRENVPGRRPVA